jgi:hypothetical protein
LKDLTTGIITQYTMLNGNYTTTTFATMLQTLLAGIMTVGLNNNHLTMFSLGNNMNLQNCSQISTKRILGM